MTIRVSTGARNAMLGNGTNLGLRAALAAGFLYLYSGSQPATADLQAQLARCSARSRSTDDGTTGLTFDAASGGVLSKAAAEAWKFHGLADGTVGWFRFSDSADTPTASSATAKRVDGLVGTAGADANMSNTAVLTGAVSTIDSFSLTLPAQ
jgi:hypothetical protein